MKVLMSIKTEYTNKILDKIKLYELRKKPFKENANTVIIYSSGKVKKVVGEFKIDKIIKDSPDNIWNLGEEVLGIDKKSFYEYFKHSKYAYAIKIKDVIKYDTPKDLSDFGIKKAPQSFCYIKEDDKRR
jgi:hypothetical protein